MILKQIKSDIFEAAFDEDICGFECVNHLAEEAGLSWQTVDNLYRGKTKHPRFETIEKLAKAVGMDLKLVKHALRAVA